MVSEPGEIWSLDFIHTRTSSGTQIRILNVVDDASGDGKRGSKWSELSL